MKLKLKIYMRILATNKEVLDFSNYSTKSKYYDNSSKSVVCKMKDETAGAAIEELVALKLKTYLMNIKMFC